MSDRSFQDGNWIDPSEAPCRLLVRLAPGEDPASALALPAVAGLVLEVGDAAAATAQIEAAHRAGRAVFLVDRPDLVRSLGADGVLLNRPGEVRAARQLLDRGELLGAVCGTTRHDAMVAGEDGADYVLFGSLAAPPAGGIDALVEQVSWWADVAVLPGVAAGRFSVSDIGLLIEAGADFILPAMDGDAGQLAVLAAPFATRVPAVQR